LTVGVDSSLRDAVGFITLNRPEQHNAIGKQMWQTIPRLMASLQKSGAHVIIISGEDDIFSSGANTSEAGALNTMDEARDLWHSIRDSLLAVKQFELPTIAMISGTCFGGGCLLACACDLRLASDDAMFAIPLARLGLSLDDATMASVVECVGAANAKRLIMTSETISAQEAERIGLVNQTLPRTQLRATTTELATRIAGNDLFSLRSAKKSINRIVSGAQLKPDENDAEVTAAFLSEAFQSRVNKKRS
jgi:enoyl-CoA hydratase